MFDKLDFFCFFNPKSKHSAQTSCPSLPLVCRHLTRCSAGTSRALPRFIYEVGRQGFCAKVYVLGGIYSSPHLFSPLQSHTVFQHGQRNGVLQEDHPDPRSARREGHVSTHLSTSFILKNQNNDDHSHTLGTFPITNSCFSQSPPNFLRAAALGEYKRPVAVMPGDEQEEDEAEPQAENRDSPQMTQVCLQHRKNKKSCILHSSPPATSNMFLSLRQYYLLSQAGIPDASAEQRDAENDGLKRELEVLKPELQLIKTEVICAALISYCPLSFSSITVVPVSGSEVCDRAESSGEPPGGRSGGAAHAQAVGHGGKRAPADGSGGPALRHRRWHGGSDRPQRSRQ